MKKFLKFSGGFIGTGLAVFIIVFIFRQYILTPKDIKEIPQNYTSSDVISNSLPSEDEVFAKFTKENWSNISIEEIKNICEELGDIISYDLALEPIEINIIYDQNISWRGVYIACQNLIKINLYQLYNNCKGEDAHMRIIETLAHEHRHAYQQQRVCQGFNTKLEKSYMNYIQPEEDYNRYYSQLAEVDARNYGSYWKNLLKLWLAA